MTDLVPASDGRELEVLIGGAGTGLPFLFHTGTPSAVVEYWPLWEAAERAGLRLVTYSRPGYGRSTPRPPDSEPTMVDDAADSLTVLDALGMGEYVTLGWSGGGPRALACAALHPDRCRAAATLAGMGPDGQPGLDFTAGMGPENVQDLELCRQGREAYRPQAEEDAAALAVVTGEQMLSALGGLVDDVDATALTAEVADYLAASFRHAFAQGAGGYLEDGLQLVRPWGFDPARVMVPVSVWQGAREKMVPFAHGEWLASVLPRARAHLFADEGHLSLMSRAGDILVDLRELAGG